VQDFEQVEETFRSAGPEAVFELLLDRARRECQARLLFDTRIMQVRHRLGLPLIQTEPVLEISGEQRSAYEAAFREAAREAGDLCLTDGDIAGAWPYFRAIGEPAPVAAAIEKFEDGDETERVIDIAFREGVHPRKGFKLILRHRGICSAISCAGAMGDSRSRGECLELLVRALYEEIAGRLAETVEGNESAPPASRRIADLISGRDWLFEGNSSYTDSTHVASVLRLAPELDDEESLRMALEMAEYGCRLAPMFHFRGDPPFEDIYRDHAVYLRALTGGDIDSAVAHFRSKAEADEGGLAAEVLIDLLVRVGRTEEAIRAFQEFFPDPNAMPMNCPSLLQLCQIAEDYTALRTLAKDRGDVLGFAAGVMQG
jgi:hypothetical protein